MKGITVFNVKNQYTLLDIILILGAKNVMNMVISSWTAHIEYLILELHTLQGTHITMPDQV